MNDLEIYIDNKRGQIPLKDALNCIAEKISNGERLSIETANDLRLTCAILLYRYSELERAAKAVVKAVEINDEASVFLEIEFLGERIKEYSSR